MDMAAFVMAFLVLLASMTGQTFEQTATQVAAILGGRGGEIKTEYVIETGNGVNPDFDNTGLPGIPDSWGDTSLAVVIGATHGGALRARTYLGSTTGYISRFDFYVASSAMATDTFVSVAVGKAISPLHFYDGNTPIAYYVQFANVGGVPKLQIKYPTVSGEQIDTWSGTVALNTVYQIYVEYNVAFDRLLFKVNNDTVTNVVLDASASTSIGTLVLGSSAGSSGRDVVYLIDRIIETPIPSGGQLPGNVTVSSPANGATNVEVSAPIQCAGTDADTWEVQYDTVNPPVAAYQSAGRTGSFIPATPLANNTTYYARCRATNENGTGPVSAVSSFTTIAATSTGTADPLGIVTAGRQAIWAQMRTDYLADTTCTSYAADSNQKIACWWYKDAIIVADRVGSNFEFGLTNAWLAHVPGENAATRCATAYLRAQNGAISGGLLAYSSGSAIGPNYHREHFTDWGLILDLCYGEWTQAQRDKWVQVMNDLSAKVLSVYGWRCGDVDQPIGNYFGLQTFSEVTKAFNPTIVSLLADPTNADAVGFAGAALKCLPATSPARTARNMIKEYYEASAAGGAWMEGTEYGGGTPFLGIQGCQALRVVQPDVCTEIDAWVDDYAAHLTHMITRDNLQYIQAGDEENPRLGVDRIWIQRANSYITLTGMLPDGAARQNLWRVYKNLFATKGPSIVDPIGTAGPGRSLMWANPYITATADLSGLSNCFQSIPFGMHIYNDGLLSTATQFWTHFPGEMRELDHAVDYWGDIQMYRRGQYVLTHPQTYAGNSLIAEGANAVAVEGLSSFPTNFFQNGDSRQFKRVTGYTCGADYMYVSGTGGGLLTPTFTVDGVGNFFDPAPRFVHEDTRSVLYLPTSTKAYDSIVVIDRINAVDPESQEKFLRFRPFSVTYTHPTCGVYRVTCWVGPGYYDVAIQRIQHYPRWTSFLHQWTEPTIAGTVTTWTMADGQVVQDHWLTPTNVTITKEDLTTLNEFGLTVDNQQGMPRLSERKWRTTIVSAAADAQWNVLARVITARNSGATAPTITSLTPTNNCGGVLITRPGNDDVVVIWNAAQGASIPQLYPTATQATAVLQTARYKTAGNCSTTWTQTTATAKVLILDMLPSLGWAYTLDGGGSTALTEDAGGLDDLSVSGTGSHTLVHTGS